MQRTATVAAMLILLVAPMGLSTADVKSEDLVLKTELSEVSPLAPLGCSLGTGSTPLTNGVAVSGTLTNQVGANCEFNYVHGTGADIVRVELTGLQFDYDLYVKRGSPPTTSSFDCRPFSGGVTPETCNVVANGQTVYVMVRRFSGATTGAFTVTASDQILPEISPGSPQTGTVAQGALALYKVNVPAGSQLLGVALAGPDPGYACSLSDACAPSEFRDADLLVRHSARGVPTTSLFDCRSQAFGTQDSCVFNTAASDAAKAAGLGGTTGDVLGTGQVGSTLAAGGGPVQVKPYTVSGSPMDGKVIVAIRGFRGPADYTVSAIVA